MNYAAIDTSRTFEQENVTISSENKTFLDSTGTIHPSVSILEINFYSEVSSAYSLRETP